MISFAFKMWDHLYSSCFKKSTQQLLSLQCFCSKGKLQRSSREINFTAIRIFCTFLHFLTELSLSEDRLFSLCFVNFRESFSLLLDVFFLFIWPFWVLLSYLVCFMLRKLLLLVSFPVLDMDKKPLKISCYTLRWNLWDYILPNADRVSLD